MRRPGSTAAPHGPSGTRSKGKTIPSPGTGSRSLLPTDDDGQKSLTVGRYQFRRDGAGWECREIIGKGRTRKRPYLVHLSRASYEKMQRKAATEDELAAKLIQWADAKKKEKRG